ncbi:MAG: SpoIID/LytB domain-containing protein, partial [Candidatus Woesebacteria bacterium]
MKKLILMAMSSYSKKYTISYLGRLLITLALIFSVFYSPAFAEPDCNNPGPGEFDVCIDKIQREIDALTPAHEYNKKELADLKVQLASLEKRIENIAIQLDALEKDILKREEDVAYTRSIFNEKTSNHYRFMRLYDPLLPFLSTDASTAFREINFREKAAKEDRNTIQELAQELIELKKDKEELERSQGGLASLRSQVRSRAVFLEDEVEKTEDYLASLTARQEELIALKAGGFQTSIGDTPPTLEPCSGPPGSSNFCDPGFRSAFAVFSFGAPHRTGMSQYGAYGRSKQGQSAEQILAAYYQGAQLNTGYAVPGSITVSGYGSIPFEDNYLLGIYEMPESWGDKGGFEALKAQAVAARSFALAATNNAAGTICATESCQVYKPQLKSGKWAEAVRATRGWVMTRDGSAAKTYYASTAGGFTIDNWGWSGIKDTSGDNWPDQAYEKIAASPWFYKGWYRTRSGSTCGREHPWLTNAEFSDIINAWHVLYRGGGDVSRVSPIDIDCWSGNPYSMSELSSIGGYTSISSVSVVYSNSGNTQSVTVSTNKGSVTIS